MDRTDAASTFVPSWFQPSDHGAQAPGDTHAQSFNRLWTAFMQARVLVAVVLLGLQAWINTVGGGGTPWLVGLTAAYLVSTLASLRWSPRSDGGRRVDLRWIWTLVIDILAFGCLLGRGR